LLSLCAVLKRESFIRKEWNYSASIHKCFFAGLFIGERRRCFFRRFGKLHGIYGRSQNVFKYPVAFRYKREDLSNELLYDVMKMSYQQACNEDR